MIKTEERLLILIDGSSYLFRAYHALPALTTASGQPTGAIYGVINMIRKLLSTYSPDGIAVVFDAKGKTFRHEMYPEYKAQREETPEGIKIAVPYIKKILDAYQIPVVEVAGFEADDAIGTMAKIAEKKDFETYMVTPDKDFCQLVSERIFMYKLRRGAKALEIWGIDEVKKEFRCERPEQVIDILALWGDAADNIKGMPGVGEKRSKDLIAKYGSLENIYNHLNDFKGKLKENLIKYKEQVELAKTLVTIKVDVPVDFNEDLYIRQDIKADELNEIFKELEFRTLSQRILKKTTTGSPQQTSLFDFADEQEQKEPEKQFADINTTEHDYKVLQTNEEIAGLVEQLQKLPEFCFDTETTSVNTIDAEIVGLSLSFEAHKAFYVPFPEDYEEAKQRLNLLKQVFENKDIAKIGQNLKYDIQILKNYGINVCGTLHDTMLAHYLLKPEQRHNMDVLAENYLNYRPVSIEKLIGKKGKHQSTMRLVPLEQIKEYACEDADITWQLYQKLIPDLKNSGQYELYEKIEIPLVPVLAQMELNGISLDAQALNDYAVELREKILSIEKSIYTDAGVEFNISSPKQLGEVLFDRMKIIDNPKKTKTKQYSTSEKELQKLKIKHPVIEKILEYRGLKKLLNTYVETLPDLINPKTKRIHTSYNQAVVATGRLSSNNPNLQNIPIRTEEGKKIRKAFTVGSNKNLLISADYSQIELRLMAHFSNDEHLIEAFRVGKDIHRATAGKIFHVDEAEVTPEMRSKAKSANFGIIYGISSFGLAENLGISRSEAKQLIDGYFAAYPKVKEFMDKQILLAREKGYVETLFGRRRYLPEINSRNAVMRGVAERNAINAPIQGTAADIIKIAMINLFKAIQELDFEAKMLLQVHDELILEFPEDKKDIMSHLVKEKMENAVKLSIPLTVEVGMGKNWLEAH